MATVPLSGTNVRLMSDIPFNNDYKNSMWFTSLVAQTDYFMRKPVVHLGTSMNFQQIEGKSLIALPKSIDALWGANYIMFQNAEYNNKWFYGFITKLEHIQKGHCHVHFEIDVLQTWRFEMNFKPSFTVREHRPLWNVDGTPVINTVDEGLDYGTEYDNVWSKNFKYNDGIKWLVVVSKTPIDTNAEVETSGSIIGAPQPLSYYMVPFTDNNDTPTVILQDGSEHGMTAPIEVMDLLYKSESAVNNVVSMYVTDYTGIPVIYKDNGSFPDTVTFLNDGNEIDVVDLMRTESGTNTHSIFVVKVNKARTFASIKFKIGNGKYDGFEEVTESKLLMHPYTSTVFDDFRGNRTEFKMEHVKDKDLHLTLKGSLGLGNKVSYGIEEYNNNEGAGNKIDLSNESALISNPANDLPVINDYLAAFLQGNRNSIETQKSSIVWNGVFGAIGSTLGAGASVAGRNPVGAVAGVTDVAKGIGDSVLQMQGIESKQKDIDNTPPQITKMGSNTAYDFGNGYNGMHIIKKQIKPEYRRILTDFFKMFGYKTNEVKIPNFNTRQNWNYVQTLSCNIRGSFNNVDLVELKAIFDNGITLWHTDDVGNYNLPNGVK